MLASDRMLPSSLLSAGFTFTSTILGGLLILQLVLACAVQLGEARYRPSQQKTALLNLNWNRVNRLIITEADGEGKEGASIELARRAAGWVLPGHYGFPVNSTAISSLLKALRSVQKGFPISTTNSGADRFKVSEANYVRRLKVMQDNRLLGILYLGTAPAYRTVYVRTGSSNQVFAVDLSPYQLNANLSDWLDARIASLPLYSLTAANLGTYRLHKDGGEWIMTWDGNQHKLTRFAAQQPLEQLNRIAVLDVLGTSQHPPDGTTHPSFTYSLDRTPGKSISYSVFKPGAADYAILKMSNQPFFMKVDWDLIKSTQAITPQQLIARDEQERQRQSNRAKSPAVPSVLHEPTARVTR